MATAMISTQATKPLMVLGTSSGAGKSLMTAAICRLLLRQGESPLPFKGQNMSNNAWVDKDGGEMAYSQALQAWSAGLDPICAMNPILLKPKGDCTSEVIHLGRSVGEAKAQTYYQEWFNSGWNAIQQGLKELNQTYLNGRLVLEGAGSPVEINLKHRDLTNMRLAKFLNAHCVLVADIERGGVFAQIMGTLSLLNKEERTLIKGILINRFRGDISLFDEGRIWLEKNTGIPVIGVMPWIKEIFPPEDSLDLLERKSRKSNADVQISVIKLPSLSNFSDLDPLEAESSVQLKWIEPGNLLGQPDAVVLPGSKQTLKDLTQLNNCNLAKQIKDFAKQGGTIFGICGGMQIMGKELKDPYGLETAELKTSSKIYSGLDLLPIHTVFEPKKTSRKRKVKSYWPASTDLMGFELHHGSCQLFSGFETVMKPIMEDPNLGWILDNKNKGSIGGTYLHGIFENGVWRRLWLNKIRRRKGLVDLPIKDKHHSEEREDLINLLADSFQKYVDLSPLTNQ